MDPTEAGEPRSVGGEPDDETMAAKKRSRRVSFAETTAVHVFDRDEDFESPLGSKLGPDEGPSPSGPGGEAAVLRWDHVDSDDDSKGSAREDEDDDEEEGEQELFIRDMDSSSPGSAVGSVTSNDDDNFFGPVSASFIKSGRLSESGMSDDNNNHDITLDSTAFSLHFRNIAHPDDRTTNSAGSIRTPTEETVPAGPQGFKKNKISGSASDTNNSMSLIVDNPHRYDYGKISPTLEALLAEVDRSMQPSSPTAGPNKLAYVEESGTDGAYVGDRIALDDRAHDGCSVGVAADRIGHPSHNTQASPRRDTSTDVKTQDSSHPVVKDYRKDDHEPTHSNIVAANAQSSDFLSPPYRMSQNNLILQSDSIHQNHFRGEGNVSPGAVPSAPESAIVDGQQLLESECGIHTPKNAVQSFQSLLQGSVSSLHAKRQQLFLDHAVLPQARLIQSPAGEQPPSSLEVELTRHGERISAIKNHISKFKILETPILINPRPALSGEDHMLLDPEGTSDKKTDDPNTKHMGASVNRIEENLINAAQKARGHEISVQLNHSGFGTPNHGGDIEKKKVVSETAKLTAAVSSLQFSKSEINAKQNALTYHNPIDRTSTPNAYGSSQRQTIVELKKNSQEGCCTPGADGTIRPSSLLEENRLQSSTPLATPISNDLRSLHSLKELANNDNFTPLYNTQEEIESTTDFTLRSQDTNIERKKDLINVREKLSERGMLASSYEPTYGDAYKEPEILSKSKRPDKGTGIVTDKNIVHSSNPMDSVPPNSTGDPRLHDYNVNYQDLLSVREPFSAQDVDIVGRKRKSEHILCKEKDTVNEISRAQRSPKLLSKAVSNIPESSLGQHVECNNEATDIGGQKTAKHCTDIISKVSEATKQLFSPSVYKLTLQETDILEDILGELQKARKYERLYTSLINGERLGDSHQQRISEVRSLQDKLIFEQVKLQLKRVKLDLLRNKAQLSQSRIQECHKLKSTFSQLIRGTRAFQTHESCLLSDSIDSNNRNQEEQNKLASKKQELEMLGQKLKCLVRSFGASCKIKGNMDCDGIIKVVNQHLEMRNRCRVIHQDLQLWELSDIVKKNDQSEIVLNYRNLLFQRFTISVGQVSSIVANNLLNDANIEKNFPNMNACMAFEFVFKGKDARRLANSKRFQEETLVTSLLLGNLLDVLEEVQLSRRELWNLICSAFHSQYSGQLELQLCFIDFKSGRKVTLGLDMTDLDCAVYPSKPSELLQFRIISGAQTTLPPSTLDEITLSVQSLQDGRPVISRLCRHVSEVVQASSR